MNESVPVQNYHYLLHPYNTSLVTCCDPEGRANIITIAWLIPVSVHPPLVGVSIHPLKGLYDLNHAHLLLHLGRNRFSTTFLESVEPQLAK
jgi:flavin reductase (DIM6/NTAB) family NADH-FMN oxidoreductase RutF